MSHCSGRAFAAVIAAKAIALKRQISLHSNNMPAQIVANARALAEQLQAKWVKVTTGGTDNHLIVFDVASRLASPVAKPELALRRRA